MSDQSYAAGLPYRSAAPHTVFWLALYDSKFRSSLPWTLFFDWCYTTSCSDIRSLFMSKSQSVEIIYGESQSVEIIYGGKSKRRNYLWMKVKA